MTTTTPLDRRLLVGLTITVPDLVAVFIDHRPGEANTCGTCRHRYTTDAPLCPSAVLARQLLKHRRYENPQAVASIRKELNTTRSDRVLPLNTPPRPQEHPTTGDLFAIDPAWRKPHHHTA